MTKQEILTAAIKKAIGNGWWTHLDSFQWNIHAGSLGDMWLLCVPDNISKTKLHISMRDVLFSHDFAEAFWGEYWRPRLQAQVLEKDFITYLEKFL